MFLKVRRIPATPNGRLHGRALSYKCQKVQDHDGRLLSVTSPVPATGVAAPVTYYTYDAASNLTSVTDAMGYVTSLGYNSRNWKTTTTLPPPTTGGTSAVITIGYNAAGWKTSETGHVKGVRNLC